jgi:hypothetical protein
MGQHCLGLSFSSFQVYSYGLSSSQRIFYAFAAWSFPFL